MYDWANSAYATTVIAGFFPIFFKSYYSVGTDGTVSTVQLGFANSISSFVALLIVQFVGFPATLLVAKLADIWDTKKVIYLCISVYIFIIIFASMMQDEQEFYILALLISLVQGGIQALSRSYYAKMIPKKYAAEFFGFYDLLGKFAVIVGPLLVAFVALFSHNSRLSIASVAILFIFGGLLLFFVDEKKVAQDVRQAME